MRHIANTTKIISFLKTFLYAISLLFYFLVFIKITQQTGNVIEFSGIDLIMKNVSKLAYIPFSASLYTLLSIILCLIAFILSCLKLRNNNIYSFILSLSCIFFLLLMVFSIPFQRDIKTTIGFDFTLMFLAVAGCIDFFKTKQNESPEKNNSTILNINIITQSGLKKKTKSEL